MSRKDYVKIARIIKAVKVNTDQSREIKNNLTRDFALFLAGKNARFASKKFFTACGY